ncbi:MAG TPA: S8 family peptidase [Frankiaceae bacterium]|nr:S8 family peptidase [Frankiaceae bacterium]
MRVARLLTAVVVTAGLVAPSAAGAAAARPVTTDRVVVQASSAEAAAAAVVRAGGTVTASLPVVDGVAATIPTARRAALAAAPGVRAVTDDARVTVHATATDGTNPSTIKNVLREEIGATYLPATGAGVRVALVDTGVNETADLAGRVVAIQDPGGTPELLRKNVACVDLSGEGDCVDRYGHGTFLAGLIAGNGAQSGGVHQGVAPGAEIVSLKIAGRNGAADVSKVLAAIQWVVSFKDQYSIDVLNLSLGTNSQAPYWLDPLNHAVEKAWGAGIVVVVAAGNSGSAFGTISKPADDPLVITVGAVDDRETPATDDDRLPNFSSRGPAPFGVAKPDLVAPGARLISLRSAGSYVEEHAGPGQLAGTPYRRGSGTSMAAAVTSGAVALLLQRHADWTPDRVKYALTSTAGKVAARDSRLVGAGLLNVLRADTARNGLANTGLYTPAQGTGSLQDSRGTVVVGSCKDAAECAKCDVDGGCPAITGENTAQGKAYNGSQYAAANWTDSSWYTSQWAAPLLDTGWYGNSWLGNSWLGNSWLGSSWYGNSDTADDYGRPARGGAWYGAWS